MEELRNVMRKWVTGVAVVTAEEEGTLHGMTVNSLASVSIDPPCIVVTLANNTRTHRMVKRTQLFGVTLLADGQQEVSDRFAGRISDDGDRFAGLKILRMSHKISVLDEGLGQLACRLIHQYEMPLSTLFVAEVLEARVGAIQSALVYANRMYHLLEL